LLVQLQQSFPVVDLKDLKIKEMSLEA